MGLWQTENFKSSVVANEIIGQIDFIFFHPTAQTWIRRVGVAATLIQQEAGSDITDIGKKIKNTLVKDYPHLKAECGKNAVRSIGKSFGRDLNRKLEDTYTPYYKVSVSSDEVTKKELEDLYQLYGDSLPPSERMNAMRIITGNETNSFQKLKKQLEGK